jgi:hypothetical protein
VSLVVGARLTRFYFIPTQQGIPDMDLSNFIPTSDTAVFELRHPITGEVLVKDDETQMTVTVFLPHSKEYKATVHEQNNKRIARAQKGKTAYTSEDLEEATLELLVKTTKDWNIQLNGESVPFSVAKAREVYDKLPWVKAQILQQQDDLVNFMRN